MEEGEIDISKKREELVKGFKNFFKKGKKAFTETDKESEDSREDGEEEIDLSKQREGIIKFYKNHKKLVWNIASVLVFVLLILIPAISIRTENLRNPGLNYMKDVTTNDYIPLALDPNVFLRYANAIVEDGSLYENDTLRYSPAGYYPYSLKPMSYFIAYLYHFINFFNPTVSVNYVDVIYPVITFAIGLIFFYLLILKLFNKKIALIASAFLAFSPAFLYRTMAGFSDHESIGIMFFFMAFYFYVVGWQSKKIYLAVLFGFLGGLSTGFMGMMWGAVSFIYLIIGGFALTEFFLGKSTKKDFYVYLSWFVGLIIIATIIWDWVLPVGALIGSFTSGIMLIALGALIIDYLFFKLDLFKIKSKVEKKIPLSVASILILIVVGVIFAYFVVGFDVLSNRIGGIYTDLISPFGKTRWQLTVAEQHQPYFTDWYGQMGKGFVWLFLIGSVYFFYVLMKPFKKGAILYSIIYALFISGFIFSRYNRGSPIFNGITTMSKVVYLGSLITFILIIIVSYIYTYYKKKDLFDRIKEIDKKYIFLFIWFIIMVVGARGAARLIFIFTPITAAIAAYFISGVIESLWDYSKRFKDNVYKWISYIIIAIIVASMLWPFGNASGTVPFFNKGMILKFHDQSQGQAKWTGPSYNQQWQVAGKWIRENTPEDAVFSHWWDYGYWVQTGGQRATITDGGNEIGWWNYQIGRMVLTGQNQTEALNVLYAHNADYLLIISDEIGKYTAYSSIGSDKNYDRYSWITNFRMDPQASKETRDEIIYTYTGSSVLDEDFDYNGELFKKNSAGIVRVYLPMKQHNETIEIMQPKALFAKDNKPYEVPLECLYYNDRFITFSEPGFKGCFIIMPSIDNNQQNNLGAGLFISERAARTLWVNLFLLNQKNPEYDSSAFELVYDDSKGNPAFPLALYNGRQIGPLKIWKINYPENFTISDEMRAGYISRKHLNPEATII